MDREITDLIASLPDESSSDTTTATALSELLQAFSSKATPTGRVHRAWSTGSVPAKMLAIYAAAILRGTFSSAEKRQLLRQRAHVRSAVQLVAGMGYLRGAATKVGQALASYPNLVPAQFVELLEALHSQAPPMHYALVREQLRSELGAEPEQVFDRFETEPFAAASLGQVHRAMSKSGEELAVKVQYPGIARTIRSDVSNLRTLLAPLRLTNNWQNMMDVLSDVEETLRRETDYRAEAANLERMRQILSDLDEVIVPRFHAEHSTERVLTMDYLPGVHLRNFMARLPSERERGHYAELILRSTYRPWCRDRFIYADCNPGNFIFMPGGRLGLVDFGCMRDIDDDGWDVMMLAISGLRGDERALLDSIRKGGLLSEKDMENAEVVGLLRASCEWLWEPLRTDEFDFSEGDYLTRGFKIYSEMIRRRVTRHMPVLTWMNRMLFGVRGLLHALMVRVPYARIDAEETAFAGISANRSDQRPKE